MKCPSLEFAPDVIHVKKKISINNVNGSTGTKPYSSTTETNGLYSKSQIIKQWKLNMFFNYNHPTSI